MWGGGGDKRVYLHEKRVLNCRVTFPRRSSVSSFVGLIVHIMSSMQKQYACIVRGKCISCLELCACTPVFNNLYMFVFHTFCLKNLVLTPEF